MLQKLSLNNLERIKNTYEDFIKTYTEESDEGS